jgi:hypothetical protein
MSGTNPTGAESAPPSPTLKRVLNVLTGQYETREWPIEADPPPPFVKVTEVQGCADHGLYEDWPWPVSADLLPDEARPVYRGKYPHGRWDEGPRGKWRITVEFTPDPQPASGEEGKP